MPYPNIGDVSQFFAELEKHWSVKVYENNDGLECVLSKLNRSVCFKWYKSSPEEFWYSMHVGDRCDLVDWTEMFKSEKKEALFNDLKIIASRYLNNKTRVSKKWLWFGSEKLQYFDNEKWHDVRSPI